MRFVKPLGYALMAVQTLSASAAALDVAVGGFYAPGAVAGYVDEIREHSEKDLSMAGVKGRVSFGFYDRLNVAVGVGYNDFVYREDLGGIEEHAAVQSIPMVIFTLGADYAFPLGPLSPFAGGGAAFARQSLQDFWHEAVDWYGGIYGEAGVRYPLTNDLAVEAGPRYTLLFDRPAVYDDLNEDDFVRSEHHSQLVELLVGVNYYF